MDVKLLEATRKNPNIKAPSDLILAAARILAASKMAMLELFQNNGNFSICLAQECQGH